MTKPYDIEFHRLRILYTDGDLDLMKFSDGKNALAAKVGLDRRKDVASCQYFTPEQWDAEFQRMQVEGKARP